MRGIFLAIILSVTTIISMGQTSITLTVGDRTMSAALTDNEATRELAELLSKGPIDIEMRDYGGFEKVGSLPKSLTTSNRQITTEPGDIMLYQGNQIVIFYGSNSWSYTPLGKTNDTNVQTLKQFLGEGNITLKISMTPTTSENGIMVDDSKSIDSVYDLKGNNLASHPRCKGLYIINGKKTVVK